MSLINSPATRKVLLDSLSLDTRAFDIQEPLGFKNINLAALYKLSKLAFGKFRMAFNALTHVCLMLLKKRVGRASSNLSFSQLKFLLLFHTIT